jgi:type IV pilus assembly protein PilX
MNITLHKQRGAALVIGLIVLLIMTLLGITSMSSTTAELKMASNLNSNNYVFQIAESEYARISGIASPYLAAIPLATWTTSTPGFTLNVATLSTTPVTAGTVSTSAQITYVGCTNVSNGTSLTETNMEGNNAMSNAYVHGVSVSAVMTGAGGAMIGQSQGRLNGKQTSIVMCP